MSDTTDHQAGLEATVAWYAPALGLGHWRFLAHHNPPELTTAARTWMADDYPHATIEVKGQANGSKDWPWRDWPEEESALHELIHVAMRELDDVALDRMVPNLPKTMRKTMRDLYRHQREALAETLARAIVAIAHADRSGAPPTVGRIVPPATEGSKP